MTISIIEEIGSRYYADWSCGLLGDLTPAFLVDLNIVISVNNRKC